MFVGKQFDIVMGVDIHIVQPPGPVPPIPIPHPFIGIVFDPMEFVPIIGASILVNGIPRAQGGTTVKNAVPHIPIGGTFIKPPTNDGELYMGGLTVLADFEPLSYAGLPILTCQDVGMKAPNRPNRKSKTKSKGLVLPLSILIPVPKGGMSIAPVPPIVKKKGKWKKKPNSKLKKRGKRRNRNGKAYPDVKGIPCPRPPYKPNNTSLRSGFTKSHKKEFKKWWTSQGKPWPKGKVEIHHIKPLSKGGTNDFKNLVPLTPNQHKKFTSWWRSFP
jgi:5-methylcytosine-specific restriction endonuclease McrA